MTNCHIDSGVPERAVLKLGARKPNRLLVLDDDEKMLALVEKVADPIGFEMAGVTSSTAFMGKYKDMSPTVVLTDRFLPGDDSVGVIKFLALNQFKGAVILFSGFDRDFLVNFSELANGQGLAVHGAIEKGRDIGKIGMLLQSVFLDAL